MQIFSVSHLQLNHPKGDQDRIPHVVVNRVNQHVQVNRNASPVGSLFCCHANLPGYQRLKHTVYLGNILFAESMLLLT